MFNKQNLPALLLVAIFIGLIPLSQRTVENNQRSNNSIYEDKQPTEKGEEALIIDGIRYDGYQKYAYVMNAMRTGNADPKKASRFGRYQPGYLKKELYKAKSSNSVRRTKSTATFTERGPSNIPGRTRSIIVDAADPSENTWFAGSVGGGIWKTSDAGLSWTELTSDLPNIAIAAMVQSASDPNVIYAGTGERMFQNLPNQNGAGILKSTDAGSSWSVLPSTETEVFENIGRIVIDPSNPDIVVVSTAPNSYYTDADDISFIFKSEDGGISWTQVYQADFHITQIISDPNDFNTLYSTINDGSIIKSTDAGDSWGNKVFLDVVLADSPTGGFNDPETGRIEMNISKNNTDVIYASLGVGQNDGSGGESRLYISFDAGETWNRANDQDSNRIIDWLGGQGGYDDAVMISPLSDSIVYLGGVAMESFMIESVSEQAGFILNSSLVDTDSLLEVVNIFTDEGISVDIEEFSTVEVRYGLTQRAYRFSVPEGSTSGVPAEDYQFEEFVDVPFQVWDIINDRQLTVSFRDNNDNGRYDLNDSLNSSREYIFVHEIEYDPDDKEGIPEIATEGGYQYRNSYLIWMKTSEDVIWDISSIGGITLSMEVEPVSVGTVEGTYTIVANPYQFNPNIGEYVGPNDVFEFHPDHHQILPINVTSSSFQILNTNDGGVWVSDVSETAGLADLSWTLRSSGFNTTTYYGADKSPTEDRFIAGAQDQGTHLSPIGESASATTEYTEEIFGDGFEAIWHSTDPDQIIGGSQNNGFDRSDDGGATFVPATFGLQDDGPFVSRLSNSTLDPDLLFAIGASGVYRSTDFGRNWTYSTIDDDRWSFWAAADVEVSLADPLIVWAGGAMEEEDEPQNLFVSKDGGLSFEATNNFADLGRVTGLYSHPYERETGYALFGAADGPKILKTSDFGQSWVDLTQFENGESLNGFPDVSTFSLLVMPHDTSMIWAGTDIGIVESVDGGASWNLLDAPDFRSVSVWDMKVKGDQVVIATHGRGVWTATIPELLDAPTPEVVLGPVLNQVGQSLEEFGMIIDYELRDQYDEINIYFNDEIVQTLPGNAETGEVSTTVPLIDIGEYTVRIEVSIGDIILRTDELVILINPFFPIADEYSNNFNDQTEDFTLDRFTIGSIPGFNSGMLQTVHPYPEADQFGLLFLNLTADLNIPIRVAASNATIRFREIVIVEVGEDGTSFGDQDFWDFVIVEGSKDGVNWTPLLDGYDSDADPDWADAYAAGASGSDGLFRSRTINMLETFSAGEIIQIRFRLLSDQLSNGWGWAIDDLFIQTNPLVNAVNDPEIESAVSIFPNPSFGNVNLTIENVLRGDINMRVIDYSGKQILNQSLYNQTGKLEQRINLSQLPFGIYVIELNNGQDIVTKKILKF